MSASQWHKLYTASIAATPDVLFDLLADAAELRTMAAGPDRVRQHHRRRPLSRPARQPVPRRQAGCAGKDWWGTVTGFQPPGALDFHYVIHVAQVRATVDVHIHYSLEQEGGRTAVTRWLVLDVSMPLILRLLRRAITSSFDRENIRTMAALKSHAEAS